MQIVHFNYINLILSFFITSFVFISGYLHFFNLNEFDQAFTGASLRNLPALSFSFQDSYYEKINEQFLRLSTIPPRLHTPDLRNQLIFYGLNGRPDYSKENSSLYFSFQSLKNLSTINPDEKIYLTYDKKLASAFKYTFSPNNAPTPLWFIAKLEGRDVSIKVSIEDNAGLEILEEDPHSQFILNEKEWVKLSPQNWEIGKWRVDGTLLARQKAKWVGVDCFLEKHGGEEFRTILGKHRVDFQDGEDAYFVYVSKGDCLAWINQKWQVIAPGLETQDKPLLTIKKIEDRLMMMELWDVDGKSKVTLNLIRTPETFVANQLIQGFKFLGARTKTQVVFQVNNERMIVKPDDWFILTPKGWQKLKTAQEIDDYVNRKIVGPLFVFEDIIKKDDKQTIVGTLYNAGRTDRQTIELVMLPSHTEQLQHTTKEHKGEGHPMQMVTPVASQ